MALAHADTVLMWMENTGKKEMPPQWMWHVCTGVGPDEYDPYPSVFNDPLWEWWEEVERKRKDRYKGNSSDDDEIEERGMLTNRAVRTR